MKQITEDDGLANFSVGKGGSLGIGEEGGGGDGRKGEGGIGRMRIKKEESMKNIYVHHQIMSLFFAYLENKCSDRSMEVKPSVLFGNYDRPKPANRPTDGHGGRREVTLSIMWHAEVYNWKYG